ncbi:unnamed protein product [Rhizoctonia solani]|uniref:Ricin B lectin domain-containing protein n=1 Tax=Rhizoctonia solani TaxID=456999 RepID=A0A8H3A3E3_9AGAM|nr:unnamed protein product [Rhizoctonia solani]
MASQQHTLMPGVYILKNVATGTVLDLWHGSAGEDTPVTGYELHGGDNQKARCPNYISYRGLENDAGTGVVSGTYLSFKFVRPGTAVIASASPQRWRLCACDSGHVLEPVAHPGYALDLTGSDPSNETPVILYPNYATSNQKWYFIPSSSGVTHPKAPVVVNNPQVRFEEQRTENIQPKRVPTEPDKSLGPNRVDPQDGLGQIIAGGYKRIISKYSFKWAWVDEQSGIPIGIAFNVNSDVPVPSFKSSGAPSVRTLQVKYDRDRGQPYGLSDFNGIIGSNRIYLEIPEWLIEISGAIEGGPYIGTTFAGQGSWISG